MEENKCELCGYSLEGQDRYVCPEVTWSGRQLSHVMCSQCYKALMAFGYTTAEQWGAAMDRMWDWAQRFLST